MRSERDERGCLIFHGALAKGYGRIGYYAGGGRQVVLQTHRVVWEATNGPIPDGLTVDHVAERCHSRACQDVEHMELVTRGENSRRGAGNNPTVIVNRAKTHCPRNHPYTPENTYTPPTGGRYCRICGREKTRRWRERNLEREQAKARARHQNKGATMSMEERAQTIRTRMTADLTKRLRPITNQHSLSVIVDAVVDDVSFYIEQLLEEIEGA